MVGLVGFHEAVVQADVDRGFIAVSQEHQILVIEKLDFTAECSWGKGPVAK